MRHVVVMALRSKLVLHFVVEGILLILGFLLMPTASAQTSSSQFTNTMRAVSKAQNEGRLLDAEKILRDAIAETEEKDPNSPTLANYLKRLAQIVALDGDSSEAAALRDRAIEIDRTALGPTDLRVGSDLISMASLALNQGRTYDAEQLYRQALDIAQVHLPNLKTMQDIDGVGGILGSIARFYMTEKRTGEAEAMLQEMKNTCDLLPPHPGVALVCDMVPTELAELYRIEGRAAEADQQLAVKLGTPPELASLGRAGEQYEKDGLYPQAEATYRQAIAWIEANRKLPTGIVLGATFLTEYYNRLGGALEKQGLNDQAEASYQKGLEIQEAATADRPGSLYSFNFRPLMSFYRAHGRLENVEPVIRKALALQENVLGPDSPRVTATLIDLAQLYEEEGRNDQNKYSESLRLYERAIQIEQMNTREDSRPLLSVLIPYGTLLRKMHQDAKAAEVQARINAIQSKQNAPKSTR